MQRDVDIQKEKSSNLDLKGVGLLPSIVQRMSGEQVPKPRRKEGDIVESPLNDLYLKDVPS